MCNTKPSDILQEKINWALKPLSDSIVNYTPQPDKTKTQILKEANTKEKEWGNKMIGNNSDKSNCNWTTRLGEGMVKEVLELRGENPRSPKKKEGYLPDWETDNFIYEVKTRNWTTSGTAGEKVLGTMYKYSDIPTIYGKPLKIVCVAFQEHELTTGNTKIFGELSENKKKFIELAKSMNIEYIKFSDLVKRLN